MSARFRSTVAHIALGVLIAGVLVVSVFAANGPSMLVPRSRILFAPWEAGPLSGLVSRPAWNPQTILIAFSAVVVVMLVAYGVVLASARTLSLRAIVIAFAVLHVLLLLCPPLQLTDIFNYLGYARLGALHHLNPYANVIADERHDPVFRLTTWHHLRSPYGPLFTAITYPIALLPLPAAYWGLKLLSIGLSAALLALVWRCARLLGRDPRFPLLMIGANPIYLMYELAGFHNDSLLLIPSLGALALMLARRDRLAGATLMLAVAVKFSAVLLLPFLLLGAGTRARRRRIVEGALIGSAGLAALSVLMFSFKLPNLADQGTLVNALSVPNLLGWMLGFGGAASSLVRVLDVALVFLVIHLFRRGRDWLASAGWATIGLIVSLAWLVPWYVVWVLPLAALSSNARLRAASIALTVYGVLAFVPATPLFLADHRIDPMSGGPGKASVALQQRLQ